MLKHVGAVLSSLIAHNVKTLNSMLILNAPGFFNVAWALIKKFIDPQTARRIHVVGGNEDKALRALQKLVPSDQIPQDYGGGNLSLREAARTLANDPLLIRQEVQLLHVKRKSRASLKNEWQIGPGEEMKLVCFTRSCSSASVVVKVNNNTIVKNATNQKVAGGRRDTATGLLLQARSYTLAESLWSDNGSPGLVSVELTDLDDSTSDANKLSRGYFLLVGDVKKRDATS